jgi:GNAT superfamily N-acetyltransferase
MKEEFKIWKAEFNDLEEILSLQKQAYLTEAAIYNDYTIPPLHQSLAAIQKEFEEMYFLKAVSDDNQIIGSIRLLVKKRTGFIGKLIVDERFRNKGIGRKLLAEIESIHKDNVSRFELFTGFNSEKNLYIYSSVGYREFRREKLTDKLSLVYLEKLANCTI